MTIIEVLIVSTLFLGLLILVTTFMVKGKRMATKTESLASLQREVTALSRSLGRDLARATADRFQWGKQGIIFLSSKSADSDQPNLEFDTNTGSVKWRQWMAYSLDEKTQTVRRYSQALATPTGDQFAPASAWDLADLSGLPIGEGKVMGRQILEFIPTGKADSQSLEFRIVAGGEVPLGNLSEQEKEIKVEVKTTLRLGSVKP